MCRARHAHTQGWLTSLDPPSAAQRQSWVLQGWVWGPSAWGWVARGTQPCCPCAESRPPGPRKWSSGPPQSRPPGLHPGETVLSADGSTPHMAWKCHHITSSSLGHSPGAWGDGGCTQDHHGGRPPLGGGDKLCSLLACPPQPVSGTQSPEPGGAPFSALGMGMGRVGWRAPPRRA